MKLYVGTSGWAYKQWKPSFYPADLPQSRFLEHYGRVLTACEINATFYRLQSPAAVRRWADQVPGAFRFAVKAHRALTHARKLAVDDDRAAFLAGFVDSMSGLGDRLGVVFFDIPAHHQREDSVLRSFLDALPAGPAYAFEFRHDSWDEPAVRAAVAAAGATACVDNRGGGPPTALPPGPIAYVRMRHDSYSPDERAGWRELLKREASHRDVYAFAKHESGPVDNDFGGIGLARWLAGGH